MKGAIYCIAYAAGALGLAAAVFWFVLMPLGELALNWTIIPFLTFLGL